MAQSPRVRPALPALLVVGQLVVLAGAAYWFLEVHAPRERTAVVQSWRARLTAMATDRERGLDEWLRHCQGDARSLASDPTIRHLVEGAGPGRPLPPPRDAARAHVEELLQTAARSHDYRSVTLFDAGGRATLQIRLAPGLAPADMAHPVHAVRASGKGSADLGRAAGGTIGIVVAVPVASVDPGPHMGVLALEADPEGFIFPLLRSEPHATASGESVLARREGDEVVFLVALRHEKGPPLSQRHPLRAEGFAMRAALGNREEFGEFSDYRNVPVLAATRRLQRAPWGLVVKIDVDEALMGLHQRLLTQAVAGVTLLLALGALGVAFALVLRRHQTVARQVAEVQARLSSRLYATLSAVNKLIVRCDDREALIEGACRALAETAGFPLSWVGFKEPDGRVAVAAAAGSASAYLDGIAVRWDETPVGRGPMGRAIREGVEVVIDDLDADPSFAPWRRRARRHGLRFSGAFPIVSSGDTVGALMVYGAHPGSLPGEERRLVRELAGDIGFALEVLEQRATLRSQERRQRALFEGDLIGILFGHVDGRVFDANDALLRMIGYSREELERGELAWNRITPPEYLPRDAEGVAEAREHGSCTPYEKEYLHRDGTRIPILVGHVLEEPDRVRSVAFVLDMRPLKAAEGAIEEARNRFRVFMENLPLAVAIRDAERRHVYVNPAMVEVLGRQRTEILGRRLEELDEGPVARSFQEHDERLLATRTVERYEYEAEAEGEARRLAAWHLPIPMPDGSILIGAMALDITERVRAAEEARRLAAVVEATTDFVGLARPDGSVLYINPAGRRLIGLTPDADVSASSITDYHAESVRETLRSRALPAAIQDGIWVSETTIRAANGAHIPVEQMIISHHNADGKVTALSTIMRDLREQRRTEAHYRSLVEQAPDAILLVESRTGVPLEVNPAAERLFGRPADALRLLRVPLSVTPPVQPDGRASANKALELESAALAGTPQFFEWVFLGAGGDPFPCEVRLSRVPGSERALLRFSITDLRERRSLEEQFRQAQKMEAVGRLAGGIAHDFNNLLNVILGYSEMLLRRRPEGDPDRGRLEQVVKAAERGAGLTRQLLAFSRKQILQPRVLDPNALLRDTEKMLKRVVGEDVELRLEYGARSRVRADPGQVEQAVMNLVVNARDAMPTGGALEIATSDFDVPPTEADATDSIPAGSYMVLTVRDSGMGMEAAIRSHIFEPFFTTKPEGQGTGLGLATVYGVVRQSGGHIRVDSAPDRGTTFSIFLPQVEAALEPSTRRPGRDVDRRGTETILLVEDEPAAREMIAEVLGERGYTVLTAADGVEALERAADAERIDLLLTDVVLPRASGPEAARALQANRPDLKVLFMSGYTREAVLQRGVSESWAMIEKPFTPSGLLRLVRERLDSAV